MVFFYVNKGKSSISEKDSHGLNYDQAQLSDGSGNQNHLWGVCGTANSLLQTQPEKILTLLCVKQGEIGSWNGNIRMGINYYHLLLVLFRFGKRKKTALATQFTQEIFVLPKDSGITLRNSTAYGFWWMPNYQQCVSFFFPYSYCFMCLMPCYE